LPDGNTGVYARRFSAGGAAAGDAFLVNTTTAGTQSDIALSTTPGGGFVATWVSEGQDGSGHGIYAQRFDGDGGRVGDEFLVNATTAGDQTTPAVSVDGTGTVLVAWRSDGQDGSGAGVFARHYGAAAFSTISGDPSANTLVGGGGNDVVDGRGGSDTLVGGNGSDAFLLAGPGQGSATILDFKLGEDHVEFAGAAFGGVPTGPLVPNMFALDAPTQANSRFVFETVTGVLSYDPDGTGTAAAVPMATLNVRTLSASDMLVVSSS